MAAPEGVTVNVPLPNVAVPAAPDTFKVIEPAELGVILTLALAEIVWFMPEAKLTVPPPAGLIRMEPGEAPALMVPVPAIERFPVL